MPTPQIRRTNNFIGLGEKSKQKMQEYMLAVGEKSAEGKNYVEELKEWDATQELPCPDFTHTRWRIERQTSSGTFEWRYDETNDTLFPLNRLAAILHDRLESSY